VWFNRLAYGAFSISPRAARKLGRQHNGQRTVRTPRRRDQRYQYHCMRQEDYDVAQVGQQLRRAATPAATIIEVRSGRSNSLARQNVHAQLRYYGPHAVYRAIYLTKVCAAFYARTALVIGNCATSLSRDKRKSCQTRESAALELAVGAVKARCRFRQAGASLRAHCALVVLLRSPLC